MAGFTARLKQLLKNDGCVFVRQGKGDHEIWYSPRTGTHFPVDGNTPSSVILSVVCEAKDLAAAIGAAVMISVRKGPAESRGKPNAARILRLRSLAAALAARLRMTEKGARLPSFVILSRRAS
jgi:hypothetical protein